MLIRKKEDIYQIKIDKQELNNFNIFDEEKIKELFKKIILKMKEKYPINGLLDINVYENKDYGLIVEIEKIYSFFEEIDMKIHFHIDAIFLRELNIEEIEKENIIYYYQEKYYGLYNKNIDSDIIYQSEEIIEKGMKLK